MESVFDKDAGAVEFKAGDKTLKMAPLRITEVRRLISAIEGAGKELLATDPKAGTEGVFGTLMFKCAVIIGLAVQDESVNQEFLEKNLTIPQVRQMLNDVARINGLEQWYPNLAILAGGSKPAGTPGA